jgi:hypothetical protein
MEIGANYKIGSKGFPNYTVPLTFWACDQDRAERTPAPTPVQDLECQYFSRGEGKVQLCPKKKAAGWVEADGQTVYQLQADFKNIGNTAVCNLEFAADGYPENAVSAWPAWFPTAKEAVQPGALINIGVNIRAWSLPTLTVKDFTPCARYISISKTGNKRSLLDEEAAAPAAPKAAAAAAAAAPKAAAAAAPKAAAAALAAEAAPAPSPVPADATGPKKLPKKLKPDAEEEPELTDCKTFEHGDASVELCNAGNKEWKDPKRGIRVSQVNYLLFVGNATGVCGLKVVIDGIQHATSWWPAWVGEGTYEGYLGPGAVIEVGANIPLKSGFTTVTVAEGFEACEEEDEYTPPPSPSRPAKCTHYKKGNAFLDYCTYTDTIAWKEAEWGRVAQLNGYIENVGQINICDVVININEINEATEVWPEWVWEKMETPLEPGNAVAFGANMPMKKGYPTASLKDFTDCSQHVTTPKTISYPMSNKDKVLQADPHSFVTRKMAEVAEEEEEVMVEITVVPAEGTRKNLRGF